MEPSIHLAAADNNTRMLREIVRLLGREDDVVRVRGGLYAGPLDDVDDGGERLDAWWSARTNEVMRDDDNAVWRRVVADSRPVIVWHGHISNERLVLHRACWHFRDIVDRLFEVAIPIRPANWPRPAFYNALGINGPKLGVEDWSLVRPVPNVRERAAEWESIRAREGVRQVEDDRIVVHPYDYLDGRMFELLADWTASKKVFGRVMPDNPVDPAFLAWRVRLAIERGAIEGRGEEIEFGIPAELVRK